MTAPHALAPAQGGSSQPPRKASNKPPGGFKRKRTGCMTCRGRKIRCDERKPSCSNCEKARRECVWVGGGDIFKHDQNPSVAEKRDTKFYKASATSWAQEDQMRLTTPSTLTREYQFVNMTGDIRDTAQAHPPPNLAAATVSHAPYQQMDLQALASAATFIPLPPTTYGESSQHNAMDLSHQQPGGEEMIDPNLDGVDSSGHAGLDGMVGATAAQSAQDEELTERIAQVLKAAGETDGIVQ